MQHTIELLKRHNEITIIEMPLDIYLEIPHLAYIEVKKHNGSKALLFTNPIDKRHNKRFDTPVLMNIFGSSKRLELLSGRCGESIANEIKSMLNLTPPKGLKNILSTLKRYANIRFIIPKHVKKAPCQYIRYINDDIDLYRFPILTTWEEDAGAFITMGQVYTQDIEGKKKNLGLYRLQVHSKNTLGLHWQIHKDATHFFNQYKLANKLMPVSVALGGDALYTWCGQAPLPNGIFELMLYGLIKKSRPRLIRCLSNPLSVPYDSDIVIEGWVNPNELKNEGPFGDHTGFYTPIEPYPILKISAITTKKAPIYPASVVGKPPLEDKYMGHLTERIFLPLLQTTTSGLIDYNMPENGVFHNLILASISPQYPFHAKQIMHAFWGVGQMSFVKHAIFLGPDAGDLNDYRALFVYILNRFNTSRILLSEGICDALDHSSPNYAYGGKLGLDVTQKLEEIDEHKANSSTPFIHCSDEELLAKISTLMPDVIALKQYGKQYDNSINLSVAVMGVKKTKKILNSSKSLQSLSQHLRIGVFVDWDSNDLENPYMLVWRICNNIDAKRDVEILGEQVFIDATNKGKLENHPRDWAKETNCSPSVLLSLMDKGFKIPREMFEMFQICGVRDGKPIVVESKTVESNTPSLLGTRSTTKHTE